MLKTVEMTVDLRRSPAALPPITFLNNIVCTVKTFKFLESTISPRTYCIQYFLWQWNFYVI